MHVHGCASGAESGDQNGSDCQNFVIVFTLETEQGQSMEKEIQEEKQKTSFRCLIKILLCQRLPGNSIMKERLTW